MPGEEKLASHPGSWLGDASNEFKKLPKWGKIVAGLFVLAVVAIAFYEYRKNAAAGPAGTTLAGTTNPPGSQSPFPSVNGVPLLPAGTNPIYGPNGDLTGFQGSPVIQPYPYPGSAPPTPTPITPFSWLGNIPNFSKVWEGGLNADGTQRWWFLAPGGGGQQTQFNVPKGTQIYAGGDGRWWYKLPGGQQSALTNNGAFGNPPQMVMSNTVSNPTVPPTVPRV